MKTYRGYQVMEELPGGAFHARSEAGMEVRLIPRQGLTPVPSPMNAHPHVAEVLVMREDLVVSAWVPGVSLRQLLARAGRRGLSTLPPYLSVILLQQLCRGLEHAHGSGAVVPGEVDLDSVVVGFDGRVRVTSCGAPERDVAAAALVLDQLLGETVDAELIRIIGEAREPVATRRVPTALSLEQRLGHWQVKQRQLFPRHDLPAELVAWLYPEEAGRSADEEVATWLDGERSGPVTAEPTRSAPAPLASRRVRIAALITAMVGLLAVVVHEATLKRASEITGGDRYDVPAPVAVLMSPVRDPEMAVALPKPAIIEIPKEVEPKLPRRGAGAPAVVRLSSAVHGIELETSGFSVSAPAPRWAVETISSRRGRPAPPYASLFVAEFDAKGRLDRLAQIGPSLLTLSQPTARFFAMQTDQPPDDGTFGLDFATIDGTLINWQSKLRRPDVLTDSMTTLEYRRFVLEGLSPAVTYEVMQRLNAQGTTPPVIATATIPRATSRSVMHGGFQQKGSPLDQVLLKPGVPVSVKDASRLSFVVLTTRGAPEVTTSVDVNPSLQAPFKPLQRAAKDTSGSLLSEGKSLMQRHQYAQAAVLFQQCVDLDPTDYECQEMRATALAALRSGTRQVR